MAFPFLPVIGGLLSGLGGIFGGSATRNAAARNEAYLRDLEETGMGAIDQGYEGAQGYLSDIADLWRPYGVYGENLGRQATDLYSDALGLGGAEGTQRARDAFTSSPGYEFQLNQGLDALERRAAAQGRLQSGQTGLDTLNYATGLASQDYNNWLSNLGDLSGTGLNLWQSGLSGQAGSLSDLANLETWRPGAIIDLQSGITNGMMGASNQRAEGSRQMISGGLGGLANIMGAIGGSSGGGGNIFGGYA